MKGRLAIAVAALVLLAACTQAGGLPSTSSLSYADTLLSKAQPGVSASSALSAPSASASAAAPAGAGAANPFTGLPLPADMPAGGRPVAVMVATHPRALPQRGVAAADMVLEAPVGGGLTRALALYADYRTVPQAGPVVSAQDQFVQFALAQDAILAHIGTTVYAGNLLNVTGYKDIDGIYLGTTAFQFDQNRTLPKGSGIPHEYCWFTDAGLLWAGMEMVDIAPTGPVPAMFHFAASAGTPGDTAHYVTAAFSPETAYGFAFDTEARVYRQQLAGRPYADEDGTQHAFANLLFLTCNVTPKPDGLLPHFDLAGGAGFYVANGAVTAIRWEKGAPNQPFRLFLEDGTPLTLQPGKTYMGLVPQDIPAAVVSLNAAEAQALYAQQQAEAEAQAASAAAAEAAAAAAQAEADAQAAAAASAAALSQSTPPAG